MKKLLAIAVVVMLCATMILPVAAFNGTAELLVQTGDDSGQELALWSAIAAAALVAVVILIVLGSRGGKK